MFKPAGLLGRVVPACVLLLLLLSGFTGGQEPKKDRYFVYVPIRDNKIEVFSLDPATGKLTPASSVTLDDAASCLAVGGQGKFIYAGMKKKTINTFAIDPKTGGLTPKGKATTIDNPTYISVDQGGKFLFTCYYNLNKAVVHPIEESGAVGAKIIQEVATQKNPHSILADASNQFVFCPNAGTNLVLQFKLDAKTGMLTANGKGTSEAMGPRHIAFHPKQDLAYVVNESASSVTGYKLDKAAGTLTAFQTITSLPADFKDKNSGADIHLTPDGKYLYSSNRGHDSIACFAINDKGELTSIGHQATESVPRAFNIDPTGNYLMAAGQKTEMLATYKIDSATGKLQPLSTYKVGRLPVWVTVIKMPE